MEESVNSYDGDEMQGYELQEYDQETVEVIENEEPNGELVQTVEEDEASIEIANETNTQALQQLILMKSRVAIENKIKTDVSLKYLEYKTDYSRNNLNDVNRKIITVNEENQQFENCIAIENKNFDQIKREVTNTQMLLDVISKQTTRNVIVEDELTNNMNELTNDYTNIKEQYKKDLEHHHMLLENQKEFEGSVLRQKEILNEEEIKLSAAHQLIGSLIQGLNDDTEKLRGLSDELKQLEDYYSRRKEEREEVSSSKKEYEDNLNNIENDINLLGVQKNNIIADFNKVMDDSNTEYQSVYTRLESLIKTMDDLNKSELHLKTEITKIEEIISGTKIENAELSKESTTLEIRLNSTDTYTQLEEQLLEEINGYSTEIEAIKNEINRTISDISISNKLKETEKEYVDKLNQQINEHNESIQKYRTEQDGLKKQAHEMDSFIIQLQEQHNLFTKLQSDLNNINKNINIIKDNNATDQNELTNKLNRLKTEHQILTETTKSIHQQEIDASTDKFLTCQRQLEKEKRTSVFEELQAKKKLRDILLVKVKSLSRYSSNEKSVSPVPIGILKPPTGFAAPTTPTKNVSFKPTVSWNTISADSSESTLEDLLKIGAGSSTDAYKSMSDWFDSVRNSPPVRLPKPKSKNRFD